MIRSVYRSLSAGSASGVLGLRSIAFAKAILAWAGDPGPLQAWLATQALQGCRVLEVNEAGTLSPELRSLPHHVLASYPEVDVHALPYADASFDLVVHSDTLEHVSNPIRALAADSDGMRTAIPTQGGH